MKRGFVISHRPRLQEQQTPMRGKYPSCVTQHFFSPNVFLTVLPVTEQEERLLWQVNGPMLHYCIYFRQVLGLPAVGSTEQQVEKSASLVAAEAFAPEKSLLIVRNAGQRKEGEVDSGLSIHPAVRQATLPSTHKQRQCFLETSSILFLRSSQGSVKMMEPGSAMGR